MRNLRHRRVSLGGVGITIKLEVGSVLNSEDMLNSVRTDSAGELHRRDIVGDVGDFGGDAGGEAGGGTSMRTLIGQDDISVDE